MSMHLGSLLRFCITSFLIDAILHGCYYTHTMKITRPLLRLLPLCLCVSTLASLPLSGRIKPPAVLANPDITMKSGLQLRVVIHSEHAAGSREPIATVIKLHSLHERGKSITLDRLPVDPRLEYDVQICFLHQVHEDAEGNLIVRLQGGSQKQYIVSPQRLQQLSSK